MSVRLAPLVNPSLSPTDDKPTRVESKAQNGTTFGWPGFESLAWYSAVKGWIMAEPEDDYCGTGIGIFAAVLVSVLIFWVPIVGLIIYAVLKE